MKSQDKGLDDFENNKGEISSGRDNENNNHDNKVSLIYLLYFLQSFPFFIVIIYIYPCPYLFLIHLISNSNFFRKETSKT